MQCNAMQCNAMQCGADAGSAGIAGSSQSRRSGLWSARSVTPPMAPSTLFSRLPHSSRSRSGFEMGSRFVEIAAMFVGESCEVYGGEGAVYGEDAAVYGDSGAVYGCKSDVVMLRRISGARCGRL
eukprot:3075866-Rhodomonas_salina.1